MNNIFEKCKIEQDLRKIIDRDLGSTKKAKAKVAVRYYNAEHDINDYRIFYTNAEGEFIEDTSRSNIKISHPFYTELIDQKTNYLLSGFKVNSADPKLDQELSGYFDEIFKSELSETVENASKIGFSYMYAQYGKDFKTHFKFADGMGIIEIVNSDDESLEYIVNYYVTRENEVTKKKVIAIEVCDNMMTYYYLLKGNKLEADPTKNINPRPHKVWREFEKDGSVKYKGQGFKYIPFFRLDNNIEQYSDLKPIKHLIDDYDLMACGLSNNLQDIAEGIYVVKGFQGNDLTELQRNIKTKKIVGVGENGGLDIQTINIPYEARKTKLELDENAIYRFGMCFNSNLTGTGNITNVVIKSRYTLLELKCEKMLRKLRAFFQNILKIVIDEINENNETTYTIDDVDVCYDRITLTNALDTAQIEQTEAQTKQIKINTILNTATYLTDEVITEKICEVMDIDYNEVKEEINKKQEIKNNINMLNSLFDDNESINTLGNASNTQEFTPKSEG